MGNGCLTCKFEPKWGDIVGCGEYRRRSGQCKWIPEENIPNAVTISYSLISWFVDDKEPHIGNCQAWRKK